uniref:Uncharacterized protein n=1 Tax=Trichogramma kaykai TaxID=54128 RepID=A0ABD2X8P9_9HYME
MFVRCGGEAKGGKRGPISRGSEPVPRGSRLCGPGVNRLYCACIACRSRRCARASILVRSSIVHIANAL